MVRPLCFILLASVLSACTYGIHEESTSHDAIAPPVAPPPAVAVPAVDTVHTMTELKLKLTEAYCLENYGLKSYRLDSPRMIVVHYTAIPDLKTTFALFKRNYIPTDQDSAKQFSTLNVGIHYVVDKDGKIYNMLPDSIVARHLIGFNHVALGIENVAADSTELTGAQLRSNVELIRYLTSRYPSIRYVIGHNEYNLVRLPHFRLFKSLELKYAPYDKTDPGRVFMAQLRDSLSVRYQLILEK